MDGAHTNNNIYNKTRSKTYLKQQKIHKRTQHNIIMDGPQTTQLYIIRNIQQSKTIIKTINETQSSCVAL